jgi:hypothetical protein
MVMPYKRLRCFCLRSAAQTRLPGLLDASICVAQFRNSHIRHSLDDLFRRSDSQVTQPAQAKFLSLSLGGQMLGALLVIDVTSPGAGSIISIVRNLPLS